MRRYEKMLDTKTVLNWEQLEKGYIEDRASIKDTYILSHAIDRLQKKYPQNIQIFQIAHSHFGNPIYAIRISKKESLDETNSNNTSSKKTKGDILHVAAIHGNEIFKTNALLNGMEDILSTTTYDSFWSNIIFGLYLCSIQMATGWQCERPLQRVLVIRMEEI